ncbi:hypothetical protein EUGRSUZ_H00490 [Eucalyptus grandis]|uniref:Uncharacterized protein n=2 Tax=Eucalyptus grandis TaxID=71139 RepID=A0ACC3JKN5_EUCGR|nr:hypothetical protein EUGRSUZ_H00490 [Eucalyptus grandis]
MSVKKRQRPETGCWCQLYGGDIVLLRRKMREKGWVESGERIVSSKWWEGWETKELTNRSILVHYKSKRIPGTASFRLIKLLIDYYFTLIYNHERWDLWRVLN